MIIKFKRFTGSSLIEVMLAAAVVSIAIIGGVSYRYYSSLDGRRANIHATTARVALMLCESWGGTNGSLTYDPVVHLDSDSLTITADDGPEAPADFTTLSSHKLIVSNVTCYATLSFKDIDTGLRALNVRVAWQRRDKSDKGLSDMDSVFELSSYVYW
jgi:Tfp pilus assembly protein PilE